MAYDAQRGKVVLFGGVISRLVWPAGGGPSISSTFFGDTWEWDGSTGIWTQRFPSNSPGVRARHAMAYDANRGRVVLFGGGSQSTTMGDTWEWDGTNWLQRATTGPSPRQYHAMAYDETAQKTVLYGGQNQKTDTWEWDGSVWTIRCTNCPPGPRQQHAMAYDATVDRTILYGGDMAPGLSVWRWDGVAGTWSALPLSPGPGNRYSHGMAYDADCGRVALVGGAGSSVHDMWELNGATGQWTEVAIGGSLYAIITGMVFDARNHRLVTSGYTDWLYYSPGTHETATPQPLITSQPANVTVAVGQSAVFSISASACCPPLTYQWRKNGVNIAGATGATLTFNPTATADAGSYECVVSDNCGSTTSSAAILTVICVPQITVQPINQTIVLGASASFTISATPLSPPLTYQWRHDGIPVPSGTSSTLVISPTIVTDAGVYDCVVTNTCGSAVSATARLNFYGNISGVVWWDQNADGINGGEPSLDARTVVLSRPDGSFVASTLTNPGGGYLFNNVVPGLYTVAEVLPNNWIETFPAPNYHFVTVAQVGSVTGINFGVWNCSGNLPTGKCCVPPPANLVLWMPFNESSGSIAYNATGGYNGQHIGGPTIIPGGQVQNALQFDGGNDWVDVPAYKEVFTPPDLGTGDFTLDAWVRRMPTPPSLGVRTIVDKRVSAGGQLWGYWLYLQDGELRLQLAVSTPVTHASGLPVPADGNWHFVAVTVSRSTGVGKFYVDNLPPVTFTPTPTSGSLATSGSFRVGAQTAANPGSGVFLGGIDEVEMFRRALRKAEIDSIYNGSAIGKCHSYCYLPPVATICPNVSTVTITAQICNATSQAIVYDYYLHGLPGCGAMITTFAPSQGQITVQPLDCEPITVTISRPTGLTNWNLAACYELVARPHNTTDYFRCRGTVRFGGKLCWRYPIWTSETNRAIGDSTITIGGVMIQNTTGALTHFNYRYVVLDEDMQPDLTTVSLNGLPPGTPVTGALSLPRGESHVMGIQFRFVEPDPMRSYTLAAESDADSAGFMVTQATMELRNVTSATCDCPFQGDINGDGVVDVFDVIDVIGIAFSGNPDPQDTLCPSTRGDVDNNGVADVFDVIYLIATAFSGGPGPVNPCP